MIVELGHLALVLALGLALLIGVFGLLGAALNHGRLMAATSTLVSGQFVFVSLAFAALTLAFLEDDFSVAYVAANSNSLMPSIYKFSAVWGAHEGSFLLWILIMSGWTLAVAIKGRDLPDSFLARVLGVMGVLNLGFLAFLLFTLWFFRDPERRTPGDDDALIAPADGRIIRAGPEGISIFMNVFNVHVCRAPRGGQVLAVEHSPGRFLAAYKDDAPLHNERTTIVVANGGREQRFTLIAGLIAPLILELLEIGLHRPRVWITPALILVAGMALRWVIVFAGQA